MIINAVIESKDGGTLVLDFPRSIYDVYEKLQSVGIRQSPHQITLSDEEGDDVRVKLYSQTRGCTESQDRSRSGLEERGAKGKVFI